MGLLFTLYARPHTEILTDPQITTWRGQLLEGAAGVFGSEGHSEPAEPAIYVKTLHAKIGELTLVNDFLSGVLGKARLLPSAKS